MCQSCFFSGRKAKGHKLTHPMQEYCTAVSLTATNVPTLCKSTESARMQVLVCKSTLKGKESYKCGLSNSKKPVAVGVSS